MTDIGSVKPNPFDQLDYMNACTTKLDIFSTVMSFLSTEKSAESIFDKTSQIQKWLKLYIPCKIQPVTVKKTSKVPIMTAMTQQKSETSSLHARLLLDFKKNVTMLDLVQSSKSPVIEKYNLISCGSLCMKRN